MNEVSCRKMVLLTSPILNEMNEQLNVGKISAQNILIYLSLNAPLKTANKFRTFFTCDLLN